LKNIYEKGNNIHAYTHIRTYMHTLTQEHKGK